MMTPEAPKIRDLTGGRIRLPIDLVTSPVVDLLVAAWAREMDRDEQATYEVGAEWFDELGDRVPDDLASEMGELGGAWGTTWFAVMGLATVRRSRTTPTASSIGSRISTRRNSDWPSSAGRQGAADPGAPPSGGRRQRGTGRGAGRVRRQGGVHRFDPPADGARPRSLVSRVTAALRRFWSECLSPMVEEWPAALQRDADAKQAQVGVDLPEGLIELATNGLDYRIPAGVTGWCWPRRCYSRPWSVIDDHGRCSLSSTGGRRVPLADPDAPPGWMVKTYKALGTSGGFASSAAWPRARPASMTSPRCSGWPSRPCTTTSGSCVAPGWYGW